MDAIFFGESGRHGVSRLVLARLLLDTLKRWVF
jgi:hypothetical protein